MDPMAEKYYSISPYAYCGNNPVKFVDPDGKVPVFLLPLAKGTVGAIVDAAAQISVSMANGKDFGEAISNIDYTSVSASFVTSALAMPGMSTTAKVVTGAAIAVDATVDISTSKGVETVLTDDKNFTNAVIDATSSFLPGKAIDGVTSGFNKAVTSDLAATSAATMTNETKSGLKQARTIVNSTTVQTGANAVGDFIGGLIGGQTNESIRKMKENSTSIQPTDATQIKKTIYPIILP